MKFTINQCITLLLLCITSSFNAQASTLVSKHFGNIENLDMAGKSFQGQIRAKGVFGLFSVQGTLIFKSELLIWQMGDSRESAPYEINKINEALIFTAHMKMADGTYVDWSGVYDGYSLKNVTAIWNRAEENDFIHELFFSDVVELLFTQEQER